ncbi:MAG: PAS-domain containing protein [Sneathiella sp.]|nr:PAS-domain containing protein [Sneathiella sp.]
MLIISLTSAFFANDIFGSWAYFATGLSSGLTISIVYLIATNEFGTNINAEKIKTEHKQLMDAVEILDDGFLLFDKKQNVVVANEKIRNLYNGMDNPFTHGDNRKEIAKAIHHWFEDDAQKEQLESIIESIDKKILTPRENIQWVLPNGKHILINEQYTHDQGIVSIIRDVTDHNQKQQDLEDRSHLLKAVFENVPIGICVYDSEHRVLNWNEKYLEIMDVNRDIIYPGIHMKDLLKANFDTYDDVGESPENFANSVLENLQLNSLTKIERKTKSGKFIEVFLTILPDGGYIYTFTDVTLTRSAQLVLQESEARYKKMVELSPDAILVQKDGLIIFANAAALKLLGIVNLHDLIGAHVRKFFPTNHLDKLNGHFGSSDHMSAGDNVPSVTSQIIRIDGSRVNVEIEATALLYGDRPVMQLIARDITAQTKTQEFLQKAKEDAEYASQLRGTFLANMSHELRTPLNAVIGFSEIIKNQIFGKVGSEKYLEYADDIHSSGIHLLDLINDILDFSKVETNEQRLFEETVEVKKLVSDCLRLVEHQRERAQIKISTHIGNKIPNVVVDAKILKQVLLNLLSNALKFTPKGGKITVHADMTPDGTLFVSVQDTGIGIKEEDLTKALTPFVQIDSELNRKYQGTGLGLPLSKNLMKLHGGDLDLRSKFGEGTNVTITLPSDRVERTAA